MRYGYSGCVVGDGAGTEYICGGGGSSEFVVVLVTVG